MLKISERGIKKFFKKNPRGWIALEGASNPLKKNFLPDVTIEKILSENFPDYYTEWKKSCTYNSETSEYSIFFFPASMFYTDAKSFNEYCEFLFDVLFRLRRMVGDVLDYSSDKKRYCAKIGEKILTSYLKRNHKTYKLVGVLINATPFYRFLRFIAHGLKLNNKSKYYVLITQFLRKITHSKPPMSSYSQE